MKNSTYLLLVENLINCKTFFVLCAFLSDEYMSTCIVRVCVCVCVQNRLMPNSIPSPDCVLTPWRWCPDALLRYDAETSSSSLLLLLLLCCCCRWHSANHAPVCFTELRTGYTSDIPVSSHSRQPLNIEPYVDLLADWELVRVDWSGRLKDFAGLSISVTVFLLIICDFRKESI